MASSSSSSSDSEKRFSGYIYNLINNLTGEVFYVGSTTQSLNRRLSDHKRDSFRPERSDYNCKKSIYIREIGKDNFRIERIVTFDDLIQLEKSKLEQYYVLQNGMNTNTCVPGRSNKESCKAYYNKNKDQYKEYYNNKKDEILEKSKQVCKCNECGFTYTYANKTNHLISRLHADGKRLCDLD